MFIFTENQSFQSVNPANLVSPETQMECDHLFYNKTEEGWIAPGESIHFEYTAGSGYDLWCCFEHSYSFAPPIDKSSEYIFPDFPWWGECTGNATITFDNAGETILYCIDEGEMSTFGDGINLSLRLGSITIEITNNFDCWVYFMYSIRIYGCLNTGIGSPPAPKRPS